MASHDQPSSAGSPRPDRQGGPTRGPAASMATNFGAAAEDYARFRAGFPPSLFQRLAALGVGLAGQTVVDLGTGTGSLARGLARQGCQVIGLDPDARLLLQARQLAAEETVPLGLTCGLAEAIPLPTGLADGLAAGQCWHWFDAPRAAREMARLARRGGWGLVAHFDWLPLPGSLVEATERLILAHNPTWHLAGGDGLHPESLPHLRAAGWTDFEILTYDLEVPYTPEGWRRRIRASAGVGASLSPAGVEAFDAALERLLAHSFPGDPLQVPHRVFAAVAWRPS